MKQLSLIQSNIYEGINLHRQLSMWRFQDKKIVFSNGCFDILHLGHINYLARAADLGDILIIGLNSDFSIKNIKGGNRPIIDEKSRAMTLASLRFVDGVVLFDEDTPSNLIETVLPDILVKGGDYEAEEVVGYKTVTENGGEVVILNLVEGYSTTKIESKIRDGLKG
ncbi:MAG: D-glycero-beta-D-manno-heptose 1-phosphate adenylyltransferase [Bacteroidales bacterium]|nr:D-glycero-beta-D-manno-heptose 1-phosphate adenylyltransferase [Bacteroidales bacterium]